MTRAELIERMKGRLANNLGSPDVSRVMIDRVLTALGRETVAALASGESVPVREVGKIMLATRAARQGRNPQTGESIHIPETRHVKIKQSKGLKAILNQKS